MDFKKYQDEANQHFFSADGFDDTMPFDGDMYADPDAINQLPAMMSENGDPITLAQSDEGLVYLNENTGEVTLAENVYLQENAYLQENSIYPSYATEY